MSHARSMMVLIVSTLAFTVCFAVWLMFGVTGIPIRTQLNLNSTQFGLLTATPVLTGAVFRLPLGIWTDRFGGRIIMLLLLIGCAVPLWLSSYAKALWQFLLLGLALGLVGASFSVGTPYVARFFPKERRGLAMGIFGAGTVGAALNMFVAPAQSLCCGAPSHRNRILDILGPGSWRHRLCCPVDTEPTCRPPRSARLEVLPVLFDRLRRLHGAVDLDATIFQD
jgi:nitrate/nitrite transporter NarK